MFMKNMIKVVVLRAQIMVVLEFKWWWKVFRVVVQWREVERSESKR